MKCFAGKDVVMLSNNRTSGTTRELLEKFKGGVIMDVTTPEQARIAEEAGACAVMALGAFLPISVQQGVLHGWPTRILFSGSWIQ